MGLKSKFRKPRTLINDLNFEGLSLPRKQKVVEDSGFTSLRNSAESFRSQDRKQGLNNLELVKHKATVLRAKKLYDMWVHIDEKKETEEMPKLTTTSSKKIYSTSRHFRNFSQQQSSKAFYSPTSTTDKAFKIAKQSGQSHLLQALNQEISSVQLKTAKVDSLKS